jgi:hypothetical protein
MYSTTRAFKLAACVFAVVTIAITTNSARFIARAKALPQPQQATGQTAPKQLVGAIQAIKDNTITLKPDAGPAVDVLLQSSVRILRVAPGQTDLKNATAIQLADLQVGDRVLVRATPSADGQSLAKARNRRIGRCCRSLQWDNKRLRRRAGRGQSHRHSHRERHHHPPICTGFRAI